MGSPRALEHLDLVESIGPAYSVPVMRDLGSSWQVHRPLLDLMGNWGSVFGDPMAEPQYTEVRLSPIGELALECEEHAVGPVPIGLVNGSLYRRGQAPPLDPARALHTVGALIEDDSIPDGELERLIGLPLLPTGGTPLGVAVDEIASNLGTKGLNPLHNLPGPLGLLDVRDESFGTAGIRIVMLPKAGADLDALERWARGVWPVTIESNCRYRGGIGEVLRVWADNCRVDRSGLEKLTAFTS